MSHQYADHRTGRYVPRAERVSTDTLMTDLARRTRETHTSDMAERWQNVSDSWTRGQVTLP
jgi:hypothetical protein